MFVDEEVSSSPPASVTHTPHSTLPRSLQGKKLPPTPQGDDDSGGSFTSNHSGGGGSLPRRPKRKSQDLFLRIGLDVLMTAILPLGSLDPFWIEVP